MSNQQLHKRLDKQIVATIFERYLAREITVADARQYLGVGRSRFFAVLKQYQRQGDEFTVAYQRSSPKRISAAAETLILDELKKEKALIENKDIAIRTYNYSAIRDTLLEKHNAAVSVPTIISRARAGGYYQQKKEKKIHDREVLTNFVGELVQHDSSHHLWSPYMDNKLYLITTIDDYSRLLLYADLVERETTWAHINAVKSVVLQYGCPFKYYADQHRIFRFVKNRDKQSPWRNYARFTDDVNPQWKQVILDCGSEPVYALSPQAKGKAERPYGWLQDRIVRTAAKENLTTITELRTVLRDLVTQYNTKWVHSTTKEIPLNRFEKALNNQHCLFKPLQLAQPNRHINDIFCLRAQRVVNSYRKILLDGVELVVPKGVPRQTVDLHLVPDTRNNILGVRFWQGEFFLGSQNIPLKDFKTIVQF
jgi:uncharacterized membrane protein